MKVLATYNMFREGYSELMEKFDVTFPPEGQESFSYEEVLEIIHEYDVLHSMYNFPVTPELMDKAVNLKLVSNYAAGFENINVEYATKKGIVVTNTPDPVTEPTADMAMGLMLSVMRRIADCDKRLRTGNLEWGLLDNLGYSLWGKTLGIYGMGRIGQALARRAKAAGMKVIYNNRRPVDKHIEQLYDAKYVSFEELLSSSDVISLNAPNTAETFHIINKNTIDKMKPTATIINTARGPLVDEKELADALKAKRIYGAGLDVFEGGHNVSKELLNLDNVVLTPHTGTQTYDVRNEMAHFASKNIINFFEGGRVCRVN